MTNTCKTCRHWRRIRDEDYKDSEGEIWPGPHGECRKINEYSNDEPAWIWITPDGAQVDASLITRESFSCCLYESGEGD